MVCSYGYFRIFLPLYFFSVGDGLQQRPGRNQATGQPPQGNVFRGNYLNYLNKFVINNCIYKDVIVSLLNEYR